MRTILLILLFLLVRQSISLTASQVSTFCHCDITASYCDFECCCDLDCSSTINSSCFYRKSSLFCLNSTYYFKIDSSLTPSQTNTGCYYYNSSSTLQEQVSISDSQINQIAANGKQVISLAITQNSMDPGFRLGDQMLISGASQFNYVASNGNCLASGSTTGYNFKIGWRLNSDIECKGTSNSINLFSSILGKSTSAYSSSTTKLVNIPNPSTAYNEVIIYIIIGRYGSSNIQYIQTIKTQGIINSNTNIRTLRIRFVDPQIDLQQEQSSPSFFPQIPYDIFYPIYQIAYSF